MTQVVINARGTNIERSIVGGNVRIDIDNTGIEEAIVRADDAADAAQAAATSLQQIGEQVEADVEEKLNELSSVDFATRIGNLEDAMVAQALRITNLEQNGGGSASNPFWIQDPTITSDGSAAVGETLTGNPGVISNGTFASGQWLRGTTAIAGATSNTYLLTVADNGKDIYYRVTATGPGGSAQKLSAGVAVAALPNVSIAGPATIDEGNTGTTPVVFTVSRSSSAGPASIPWSFSPGTTGASDFVGNAYPTGGTVDLADGVSSGTITINVRGEQIVESDEYFTISITAPAGYVPGAQTSATSTILNVDVVQPATITSVDSTGAFAFWDGTAPTLVPDENPRAFQITRQGFDAQGQPTTFSAQRICTKRVREPYPNQTQLTASRVSLDDYVYATDTIVGATNNSTEASPPPHARWARSDRALIGNSLDLEIVAFHRDGIACVEFTVTDGTTTLTQRVSEMTISPATTDRNPVLVYRALINVTGLADNALITANARVFPKIGTSAAIIDSSVNTQNTRSFCPQIFYRSTTRFASPPLVYVAAGGSDTTGVVSTDPGTASAAPCATLAGAYTRARAVLGTANGALNGLRVRLGTGTWSKDAVVTNSVTDCMVVIERDPAVTKAQAILAFGATTQNGFAPATFTRVRDLTLLRTGNFTAGAPAGGRIVFGSVIFDIGANNGALATSLTTNHFFEGTEFVDEVALGSVLAPGTNYQIWGVRGVKGGKIGSANSVEDFCVLGCLFKGVGVGSGPRSSASNIVAFNTFLSTSSPGLASPDTTAGYALVQNVIEYSTGTNRAIGISADGASFNAYHVIMWHNTIAGFGINGRSNVYYNETNGVVRTHRVNSMMGNIHTQLNTKHDVFQGLNHGDPNGDANTRVGGWSYLYGVGCYGEFTMFSDAGGGQWTQEYVGFGSKLSTSLSVRLDPLFEDYRGVQSNGTPGTGGGNYQTKQNSPAEGIVLYGRLPYDLAGNPRPANNDSAGAYRPTPVS